MLKFLNKGTGEQVEAVCWNGTIDDALISWAHSGETHVPNSDSSIELSKTQRDVLIVPMVRASRTVLPVTTRSVGQVEPGDWIAKNDRRELMAFSGDDFQARFTPVFDQERAFATCELMVRAMVAGEDPASVSWSTLDQVYDMAKRVLGRDRVIEIYKQERPEKLESFLRDGDANECFEPR